MHLFSLSAILLLPLVYFQILDCTANRQPKARSKNQKATSSLENLSLLSSPGNPVLNGTSKITLVEKKPKVGKKVKSGRGKKMDAKKGHPGSGVFGIKSSTLATSAQKQQCDDDAFLNQIIRVLENFCNFDAIVLIEIIYSYCLNDNSWNLEFLGETHDWLSDNNLLSLQTCVSPCCTFTNYNFDDGRHINCIDNKRLLIQEDATCPYNSSRTIRHQIIPITNSSVDTFILGRSILVLDRYQSTDCIEIFDLNNPSFWSSSFEELEAKDPSPKCCARIDNLTKIDKNSSFHLKLYQGSDLKDFLVIIADKGFEAYHNSCDKTSPIVGIHPTFIVIDSKRLHNFKNQSLLEASADGHYFKYVNEFNEDMLDLDESSLSILTYCLKKNEDSKGKWTCE